MPGAPRTDPYVRNYLIRLLPRVVHAKPLIWVGMLYSVPARRFTYPVKSVQCFPLSPCTGRRRPCQNSPWSPAFPPEPPPRRGRPRRIVRLLLRYYADVRLLGNVHARIVATGLPLPSRRNLPAGTAELSRFSNIERKHMHRVSDSAGPGHDSPKSLVASRIAFPIVARGRRPGWGDFGAQWLAYASPVNASRAASRPPAHDSGA